MHHRKAEAHPINVVTDNLPRLSGIYLSNKVVLKKSANHFPSGSARSEIFEHDHSLFDVVADTTVDRRLCVVIEQFQTK